MPFYFNYWGKQRIAKLEKIGKPLRFPSLPIPLFHFGLNLNISQMHACTRNPELQIRLKFGIA